MTLAEKILAAHAGQKSVQPGEFVDVQVGLVMTTDAILPATYANLTDSAELGRHCMEHIAPGFARRISKGDIILAGSNFGCGSSREIAPGDVLRAGSMIRIPFF